MILYSSSLALEITFLSWSVGPCVNAFKSCLLCDNTKNRVKHPEAEEPAGVKQKLFIHNNTGTNVLPYLL